MIIESAQGCQQGDPLGVVLFCLAYQRVLRRIDEEVDHEFLASYIDDTTCITDVAGVHRILEILEEASELGFYVNRAKCIAFAPQPSRIEDYSMLPDDIIIEHEGVELLGAPIGTEEYCRAHLDRAMRKAISLGEKVSFLDDLHLEYKMHTSVLTISNLVFLLRTNAPELIEMTAWREHTRSIMERLPHSSDTVDDMALVQASLSVKQGGLGLRCSELYSTAAFTASICASTPNIRVILRDEQWTFAGLQGYIEALREESSPELFPSDLEIASGLKLQRKFCKALDAHSAHDMIEEANDLREEARLRGLSSNSHCGDWLTARPDPNLHLKLNNRQFAAAIRYRLGLPMYKECQRCYSCGGILDTQGDHAMHCKKEGYLVGRHNGIQGLLIDLAAATGLNLKKEDNRLMPDKHGKRPGDIIINSGAG